MTEFTDNNARNTAGAIYSRYDNLITFKEHSATEFTNNTATINGGAIFFTHSHISFEDNSTTKFINNTAGVDGGAIILSFWTGVLHTVLTCHLKVMLI